MNTVARAYQISPVIFTLLTIVVIIVYYDTPNIWTYKDIGPMTEQKSLEKTKREGARGTIISFVIQFFMVFLLMFLEYIKVPRQTILVNFGLIIIPVLNFIFDQLIGTDKGMDLFMNYPPSEQAAFLFNRMGSPIFFRYFITVLLDLFISSPMIDAIKANTLGSIEQLKTYKSSNYIVQEMTKLVGKNIDTVLYTMMQILTFNAYTNQSRFNWAYRTSTSIKNEQTIPSGSILLICGLASVFYITYEYPGATPFNIRFLFTFVMLSLLSIGYMINYVEPKYTKEVTFSDQTLQKMKGTVRLDTIKGKAYNSNNKITRELTSQDELGVTVFSLFLIFIIYSISQAKVLNLY